MKMFISSLSFAPVPIGRNPGIAISFDDTSRSDGWANFHDNYGKAHGWRASFFVYTTTSIVQRNRLIYLYNEGHEMQNHTSTHFNGAPAYVEKYGAEAYYLNHCKPLDDWVVSYGMNHPDTFRFPYGFLSQEAIDYFDANNLYKGVSKGKSHENTLDTSLYTPVAYYSEALRSDKLYWEEEPTLDPADYNLQIFTDALDYAKATNQIFLMVGHDIGEAYGARNIPIDIMDGICSYVNEQSMKFYLWSEIY